MARRGLLTNEALEEDIVRHLATLRERANLKADEFYEPLMLIGNTRVKVWVALKMHDGWMSVPEITRLADVSRSSVYEALEELTRLGMLLNDDYMYRLDPDFRTNL